MAIQQLVSDLVDRAREQQPRPFLSASLTFLVLVVTFQLVRAIYNLYFHPLASIPGPILARCSRIWYVYHLLRGQLPFAVYRAHQKYGPALRIAPDELAFVGNDTWKDIYGFSHGSGGEMPKDPLFYLNTAAGELSIIAAPSSRHGELRRLMSHGFSERALRAQEPIIQHYLDYFILRLRGLAEKGAEANLVDWYNFFTFDVIGDLAFAEPFDCLKNSKNHPWIDDAFDVLVIGSLMRATDYYPLLKRIILTFIPKRVFQGFANHVKYMKEKALNRLHMKTDRLDFMTRMAAPGAGLTEEEFIASADTVLLGGSETTATLLSGVTYYLLKNPRVLQKLVEEIRTKFQSEEDITLAGVNSLNYMLACLDEAFRLYPPVAGALPRRTREGDTIGGKYVTPNTTVAIYQWAMYRNPEYFTEPEEYIPERWMGDPRFKNDNRSVVQPFSYGPRNCIGRNLAYVEMRLTLARLLFSFDIEPTPCLEGWINQKVFLLWQKHPLWVKLRARGVPLRKELVALAAGEQQELK
ncbi:hypothetical protein BDW75DRAFT_247543 [Aspergillus navahoensis]